MTTPNEANEAGLKAAAQRPTDPAHDDLGRVELLVKDSKAARILAKAEAERVKAEASAASRDAEAERHHRAAMAHLEAEAAKAARKESEAATRAAQRREAADRIAAKAETVLASMRGEAAASYSGFAYLVVITVAIGSQFVFFKQLIEDAPSLQTLQGVSGLAALLAALFVEGFGLAFYATSVASRLRGRSGWVPRTAAWAVTFFAAWLQYQAHKDLLVAGKPLISYACAAASLGAMLLAEVRTTYKVGQALEALDQKDRPQARLGVKFCLRYSRHAFWAISAMIAMPSVRTRTQALRAGRAMAHLRAKARLNSYLKAEAERALRAAQRKAGTSEAILFRLQELAYLGLEGLGLQEALASAPAGLAGPQADPEAAQDEAEAERPSEPKARASRPRPTAQPLAQKATPAFAVIAEAATAKPGFAEWAEAHGWAERPGGLDGWTQRIAYLASTYPAKDDATLGVPPRATIIQDMKALALEPEEDKRPQHAWSNKGHVGWAMTDLRDLRRDGYLDPALELQNSAVEA